MGIPHLITFLQPFASESSLDGGSMVIDGPGLAYHIYSCCLATKRSQRNPFEAAPSYRELQDTATAWLDGLRCSNVKIEKIYFDGFLPPSKFDVRLTRLIANTGRLSRYHQIHSAQDWPISTPPNIPSPLRFNGSSVHSSVTALPPIPFLVPAILEALVDSDQYGHLTEVVPGEADLYCAKYLKENGGAVLTGDSDLLVHDLGAEGFVIFFKDLEPSSGDAAKKLKCLTYQPAAIAERLALPESYGLHSIAFEIFMDRHGTFPKLLAKAKSLESILEYPSAFQDYLKEFAHLPAKFSTAKSPGVLKSLQNLDPRLSEYILRFPYIIQLAGYSQDTELSSVPTTHIFLPFLLDCPGRTNAWEISALTRQLAYGVINLVLTDNQKKYTVFEHRKQDNKSRGREICLPTIEQIPEACLAILNLCSSLKKILPALSNTQFWTSVALHQDVEWSQSQCKPSSGLIVMKQMAGSENSPTAEKSLSWDIIHFFAEIQGSYYSFRILKQIMNLVMKIPFKGSIPQPVQQLHLELESLPKLKEIPDTFHFFSLLESLEQEGVAAVIRERLGIHEGETGERGEKSRGLTKKERKRKREQSSTNESSHRKISTNPFDLLGFE